MIVLGIVSQGAHELAVAANTFFTQYCLILLLIRFVATNDAPILLFQGPKAVPEMSCARSDCHFLLETSGIVRQNIIKCVECQYSLNSHEKSAELAQLVERTTLTNI
jgi:hypothetical protein